MRWSHESSVEFVLELLESHAAPVHIVGALRRYGITRSRKPGRVRDTEAGGDVLTNVCAVSGERRGDYEVFSVGRSDTQWIPLACLAVHWGRSSTAHSGQVTELRTTVCLYSLFTVPCTSPAHLCTLIVLHIFGGPMAIFWIQEHLSGSLSFIFGAVDILQRNRLLFTPH